MNSSGLDIILNPIPYTDRKRVKDDVKNLMDRYKSLMPQSAKYGKHKISFFFRMTMIFIYLIYW
jgi:hypothetical protein